MPGKLSPSDFGNFDKYIESLLFGNLLTEAELKLICEKVSTYECNLG